MRSLRLAAAAGLTLLVAACAGPSGPAGGTSPASLSPGPAPGTGLPGVLATLSGLPGVEIERRFGPPAFRHTDPPAEVWQYRNRACTLDLFLYRQPGVPLTVSHAAVRGPGGANVGESECLRAVQAARGGS